MILYDMVLKEEEFSNVFL